MTVIYLIIGLVLCGYTGYRIIFIVARFIRWFSLPFVEMCVVDVFTPEPGVNRPAVFRVTYAYELHGKIKYYNKDTLTPSYTYLLGKKAIGRMENIKYDEKNDKIPDSLGFGLIKLVTYIAAFAFGFSFLVIYYFSYLDTGSFFWSP